MRALLTILLALGATLLTAAPASAKAPDVRLSIAYDQKVGDGPVTDRRQATLRCEQGTARASGWLRVQARRACRVARAQISVLRGSKQAGACTALYGGPDRARVRGHVGAQQIDRLFTRTNGCEIADWQALSGLLPPPSDWS